MPRYTNEEYLEMVLIYGECERNARAAAAEYALRFPNRRHPRDTVITAAVRRLRENGTFVVKPPGRPRRATSADATAQVLAVVAENPHASTRSCATDLQMSQSSVWRILHHAKFHPFRVHLVHDLRPTDLPRRVAYCLWLTEMCEENPDFRTKILFSDEAHFGHDGTVNRHNCHYWAAANPRWTRPSRPQVRWSINVWCGILGHRLIGPLFLPNRLTGRRYLEFLRTTLSDILDDLPLDTVGTMWFQHDGAPPPTSTGLFTLG